MTIHQFRNQFECFNLTDLIGLLDRDGNDAVITMLNDCFDESLFDVMSSDG
jgi:hypothetical protein